MYPKREGLNSWEAPGRHIQIHEHGIPGEKCSSPTRRKTRLKLLNAQSPVVNSNSVPVQGNKPAPNCTNSLQAGLCHGSGGEFPKFPLPKAPVPGQTLAKSREISLPRPPSPSSLQLTPPFWGGKNSKGGKDSQGKAPGAWNTSLCGHKHVEKQLLA